MSTKKCPYCSENIKIEAIKCRYCGEMLGKDDSFKDDNINSSDGTFLENNNE